MKKAEEILRNAIVPAVCDEHEYENGSFIHYKDEVISAMELYASQTKAVESQHPHIEATSENLIGRVKDRFKELKGKEFDWRSFYHGWLEGRADWNFKKPTTNN